MIREPLRHVDELSLLKVSYANGCFISFSSFKGAVIDMWVCTMEMQSHIRNRCGYCHCLLLDRFDTVRKKYLLEELSCAVFRDLVQHLLHGSRLSSFHDSIGMQENSLETSHVSQVKFYFGYSFD